jgi:hypothetical protein
VSEQAGRHEGPANDHLTNRSGVLWVGRSGLNDQFADPPTPIALKHYSYRAEVSPTLLLVLIIV